MCSLPSGVTYKDTEEHSSQALPALFYLIFMTASEMDTVIIFVL